MKMLSRRVVFPGLVSLLAISAGDATQVENNPSQRALVVEAPACVETPPGAADLVTSGTTHNNQPVPSGTPGFPGAFCDSLAATWPPVGTARSYLTSDATITGTHVGSAPMHAEACLFGPPPTVLAELRITADNGDTLAARIKVVRKPDSPAAPNSEGAGKGVVTGGTGRFAGATGEFNVNARSHGTVLPGTNVATLRDIAICGYVQLRSPD